MNKAIEYLVGYLDQNKVAAYEADKNLLKPLNKTAETCSVLIHSEQPNGNFEVTELVRTPECREKIKKLLENAIPMK